VFPYETLPLGGCVGVGLIGTVQADQWVVRKRDHAGRL